ncbi:hypothetical protein [Variovorax sp. LjRoot178]|uniref:hypothetical protein n=1 Tax=Variovorax sp. LjRoot178 TaxID=3342277 RepID=UPI003ECCFB46
MAVLNLGADSKRRQSMYHVSLLPEVISAAERMRLRDFYASNALFASKRSRCSWNVKSMQVCWVDLDCYTHGIIPTDEFVETLLARAHFAGIPHPTHIVSSGRGLYLKWLLDKPVPDTRRKDWEKVQSLLTQLFVDLGADVKAIDAARVLRVVNTVNGKVGGTQGGDDRGLVRVVWAGSRRHSFESLFDAVSMLDEQTTIAILKAGAKVGHRVGANAFVPNFKLPPGAYGDVGYLTDFTDARQDRMARWGKGEKKGRFDMPLSLARALDLRDLAIMRSRAGGTRGIPEGSRDLFLFWLVNLFAQGGVINSSNVYDEVSDLIRAFDGVGIDGPRGFLHPQQSGSLNTLIRRIKASEDGHRVRFAGGEWDPRYTPSNDYFINVFGITSDEMPGLRTIIDQSEKRARADRKVEGRAERREVRSSWQADVLRVRDDLAAAREAGETSVPERKVASTIAAQLGVEVQTVRAFLRRHDDAAALKEARKTGKAPPRAYRKPADLNPVQLEERNRLNEKRRHDRLVAGIRKNGYLGDGSPEDVQAWFDAKKAASQVEMARSAAAVIEEARAKQEEGVRSMNAQLQRLMRRVTENAGAPPDANQALANGAAPTSQPAPAVSEIVVPDKHDDDLVVSPEVEAMSKTIFRGIGRLRDNPPDKDSPTIMNTLPVSPSSPVEPTAVASGARKTSKRALLDKARKAQAKEALPASANDPLIAGSAESPAEAAPTGATAIATSVIPPDLLESWGESAGGEPGQTGMPDLDDGYLDSFADGDAPVLGEPPAAGPEPAAFPSVAASRPSSVLTFARGTKPGSPAAAPGRGFGFNRPASPSAPGAPARPPAAPARFAVRKPAALPTKPLGFGAPARLSTDQAKVNGQSHDFAKLFDEPQYGDDGVPATYPAPSVWPSNDLPAGSRYTPQEWADAREADAELPTGHVVVELQVGNPVRSALIKVPRKAAPEASEPVARTVVINGKVVKQEPYRGIDDPMVDAIADTIVVSRKSPIAEEVRGAVEGGIEISHGGVSSYFRIIRPRSHYSDPEKFIFINSKLHMSGSLSEAGARMAPKAPESLADETVEQGVQEQHEQEELDAAEAPRG